MVGLYLQNLSYDNSNSMETQSTVIKSLPLMEKVAKSMGRLDKSLTQEEIRSNRHYLGIALRYKNMVSTEIEGWTNILNITVEGTNPKEVMDLANTVAAVYKEENRKEKNKRTIEARKFIEKRLGDVETNLKNVQYKIKTFKEENKFISERAEVTDLLKSINNNEIKLDNVVDKINSSEFLIRELENQTSASKNKAVSLVVDENNQIFFNHNKKRNELLTQREILLVNYTDQFPDVISLDIQLKKLEFNMLAHLKEQRRILTKTRDSVDAKIKETKSRYTSLPQMAFTLDDLEYELTNSRELYRNLRAKHQEILIKTSEMIEEVSIVRPALEPQYPINPPRTGATTGIGAMFGLILGLIIAFILETLDTSIGTIEDVEEFLKIPVLGVIPLIRSEDIRATLEKKGNLTQNSETMEMNARLISHFAPKSNLAESFKSLRTSIKFLTLDKNIKTLMVSSSVAREGKSTTIANIALTLAQIGSKVLLIDADLRKPIISKIFGIEKEPGVTDIILGNYEWQNTLKTVTDIMMGRLGMEDIMTSPGIDNLNIITAGTHSPNTTELISSQRMSDFIDETKDMFDIILIDSPPILQITDSVIISTKIDAVILIYWAGKIQRGVLKRAKTQLDNVNVKTIGVVLNGLNPEITPDYKYYGYYSSYEYSNSGSKENDYGLLKKIKYRLGLSTLLNRWSTKINNFSQNKNEKYNKVSNSLESPYFSDDNRNRQKNYLINKKIVIPFLNFLSLAGAILLLIAGIIWQIFFF